MGQFLASKRLFHEQVMGKGLALSEDYVHQAAGLVVVSSNREVSFGNLGIGEILAPWLVYDLACFGVDFD